MRVLQDNIYSQFIRNQSDVKAQIERMTSQISSGKQIDKPYQDSSVYIESMRLDSQIDSYTNIKDRITQTKMITDASDSALSGMHESIQNIHTRLIQAANGTLDAHNLQSLAETLETEKENLKRLANSSIDGHYLFSGTAVGVKPVDEMGNYHGNEKPLMVELDNRRTMSYSIDGKTLLYGVDESATKSVSSNVVLKGSNGTQINKDSKISDLLGEGSSNYHFYLNGVNHNGENVKTKITLTKDDTFETLMQKISDSYGNDVDVKLSQQGVIVVEDKQKGASKLDFQMVASSEDVNNIRDLTQKFNFNQSNLDFAIDGVDDSAYFQRDGHVLMGNLPLLADGEVAQASTTLSQIASQSLDGVGFEMRVTDISGADHTVTIDLGDSSSFTIDGNNYDIYDATLDETTHTPVSTKADNFTLGQLDNIIALAMSGETPISNDKIGIDDAVKRAKERVDVGLDPSGRIRINDKTKSQQPFKFSMFDKQADSATQKRSIAFMSNHAVIDKDPQIDLFKDLEHIIDAVKYAIRNPGDDQNHLKNMTIESAIDKIETIDAHLSNAHAKIGTLSNSLEKEGQKAETLKLHTTELQSNISDIDIAETVTKYQQVTLNYQAMMSTIAKVNSLSLLNYLK